MEAGKRGMEERKGWREEKNEGREGWRREGWKEAGGMKGRRGMQGEEGEGGRGME